MGFSDESWWEKGACRTANPAIFDGGPGARRADHRGRDWSAAKAMCASCPVQAECLRYVLSLPQESYSDASFAAGFTPNQLKKIRSGRRR